MGVTLSLALLLFLFTRFFYDINRTSLLRFYRDRLSKTFLFNPWPEPCSGSEPDCGGGSGAADRGEELPQNDGLALQDLNATCAPYHLINATINVRGSQRARLQGRNGDLFLFSRCHVGSQITGYAPTSAYEQIAPDVNLGTVMAISGAAVAPNMGSLSTGLGSFTLAMLNVRLDYWVPNPRLTQGGFGMALRRMVSRVGPSYLLREMLGLLDESSWRVNLSDGGHMENLGIYELVRRRCKLIIAVDAEADPEYTFGSLTRAVRLIRIDMGIQVEIDPTPIRPAEDGLSPTPFVVGRIRYANDQTGLLVYIKASLIAGLPVDVDAYRARNPAFPHQSTADQSFDEEQFEAYRALGYGLGRRVFA